MDGAEASDLNSTVIGKCEALTSRRAWRFFFLLLSRQKKTCEEGRVVRRTETVSSADLGVSSKYNDATSLD